MSFNQVVEACQYLLRYYPEAQATQEYLSSRLSSESQKMFQFGFFPNNNHLEALVDLIGNEILLEKELLYYKQVEDALFPRKLAFGYFDHYPLIMPFLDPYGVIRGVVGRTLLSEEEQKKLQIPKYKNNRNFEKGNYLFGLFENKQHILEKNSVYVVEGQFDMIKATEIGFNNIVALGTNNLTFYQFSLITRYTNNIFLLLDNDDGGKRGRETAIKNFGHLANIRNFYIPASFKDIDQYVTQDKIECCEDLSFGY